MAGKEAATAGCNTEADESYRDVGFVVLMLLKTRSDATTGAACNLANNPSWHRNDPSLCESLERRDRKKSSSTISREDSKTILLCVHSRRVYKKWLAGVSRIVVVL